MPNRIIKESICMSDSVDSLSWFEEVLFYRLIVNCDDYGRYDGRPAVIKNRLFPLKDESLSVDEVITAIRHLAENDLIVLYEHNGRPYLYLTTWNDHQNVRAKKSKYPPPDVNTSASNCMQMYADASKCTQMYANVPVIQSNPIQSESLSESKREAVKPPRFTPPTVEDVKAYCAERGNRVDPEAFVDFYSSKGWMIGKDKMKDWKAAVRNWERREAKPKGKITTAAEYVPPVSNLTEDQMWDLVDSI